MNLKMSSWLFPLLVSSHLYATKSALILSSELIKKCQKNTLSFDSRNFFGIKARLLTEDSILGRKQRAFRLKILDELKVRHIREDFLWQSIEPMKNKFFLGNLQDLLQITGQHGIHVLPILAYGNTLYNKDPSKNEYRPPEDLRSIIPYVDKVVNLISQNDSFYEIWNEPNSSFRFWKKGILGQPKEFGHLLKIVSSRIRQKDPKAQIVLGGLFSASTRINVGLIFLKELYKQHPDIHSYYDILAWHPYRYPQTAPETSNIIQVSLQKEIANLISFYHTQKLPAKPIWITELGWHTAPLGFPPGVSQLSQRNYLLRSHIIAMASGVSRYYWYELLDGPQSRRNLEEAFGLYQSDQGILEKVPTPKPVFEAYKYLIRVTQPFNKIIDLREEWSFPSDRYSYLLCSDHSDDFLLASWQTHLSKKSPVQIEIPRQYILKKAHNFSQETKTFKPYEIFFSEEPSFSLGQFSYKGR